MSGPGGISSGDINPGVVRVTSVRARRGAPSRLYARRWACWPKKAWASMSVSVFLLVRGQGFAPPVRAFQGSAGATVCARVQGRWRPGCFPRRARPLPWPGSVPAFGGLLRRVLWRLQALVFFLAGFWWWRFLLAGSRPWALVALASVGGRWFLVAFLLAPGRGGFSRWCQGSAGGGVGSVRAVRWLRAPVALASARGWRFLLALAPAPGAGGPGQRLAPVASAGGVASARPGRFLRSGSGSAGGWGWFPAGGLLAPGAGGFGPAPGGGVPPRRFCWPRAAVPCPASRGGFGWWSAHPWCRFVGLLALFCRVPCLFYLAVIACFSCFIANF